MEPAQRGDAGLFNSEQGLRDTIQFSRFAGMIAATGAEVPETMPAGIPYLIAEPARSRSATAQRRWPGSGWDYLARQTRR